MTFKLLLKVVENPWYWGLNMENLSCYWGRILGSPFFDGFWAKIRRKCRRMDATKNTPNCMTLDFRDRAYMSAKNHQKKSKNHKKKRLFQSLYYQVLLWTDISVWGTWISVTLKQKTLKKILTKIWNKMFHTCQPFWQYKSINSKLKKKYFSLRQFESSLTIKMCR